MGGGKQFLVKYCHYPHCLSSVVNSEATNIRSFVFSLIAGQRYWLLLGSRDANGRANGSNFDYSYIKF